MRMAVSTVTANISARCNLSALQILQQLDRVPFTPPSIDVDVSAVYMYEVKCIYSIVFTIFLCILGVAS